MKKEINLFKSSLDFIYESRKYIYVSVCLFLVSGVFGFIFADSLSFINEILKNLVDKTEGLGTVELMVFIFLNNLQSAFFGMMLGILFGIVPVINAITNGVVLGFVFEKVYNVSGFSDFWRILPHGIFELPAIFIALGIGMNLGFNVLSKKGKRGLFEQVKKAFYAFLLVILPLLIIAAIIEGLLIGFDW
ncbi:MAG: stage II sporulation protein M [Nanoarchaeota archaeon]